MPTDAKLGLFVGVGLVITIGIVFFRRDMPSTQSAVIPAHRSATVAGAVALPRPDNGEERTLQGKLMSKPTSVEPELK